MQKIYYTDGGCYPNPGNGSWAFLCTDPYIQSSGAESNTTNNRMEMMAVLNAIEHGLSVLKAEKITVFSDSQYCVKGFNEWMLRWAKKGWQIRSHGVTGPVKNVDLWQKLFQYRRNATLVWVRGHNGDEYNEQVDQLVRTKFESTFGGKMTY